MGDLIRSYWVEHEDWGLGIIVLVPEYEDYVIAVFPIHGANAIYVDEIEVISGDSRNYD